MKLKCLISLFCISICFLSMAQEHRKQPVVMEFKPFFNIQEDNLRFNISGDISGGSPNILSEISWRNIFSTVGGLGLSLNVFRFSLESSYSYGNAFAGSATDRDYAEDDRKGMFSDQYLNSDKGTVREILIQPKYLILRKSEISFSMYSIFQFTEQSLYLMNKVAQDNQDYIKGLNSSYSYSNKAVGIGLEISAETGRVTFLSRLKMGKVFYKASGNWNLRSDLEQPTSYSHNARGKSVGLEIEARYRITSRFYYFMNCSLLAERSRDGVDRLFRVNKAPYETMLNEVDRQQSVFRAGILILTNLN